MNKKKLERYLRVNLLGPGPSLVKKKNLPGRGLTKVEKQWSRLTKVGVSWFFIYVWSLINGKYFPGQKSIPQHNSIMYRSDLALSLLLNKPSVFCFQRISIIPRNWNCFESNLGELSENFKHGWFRSFAKHWMQNKERKRETDRPLINLAQYPN